MPVVPRVAFRSGLRLALLGRRHRDLALPGAGPERSRSGELRRSILAAEKEQLVPENMEAERELALVKAEIEVLKAQLNN